jgi:hypothetical protein
MSPKWCSIVRTGFSAFMPACRTSAKPLRLAWRSRSPLRLAMSVPSNLIVPAVRRAGGRSIRVRANPSVDLPHPDSPTSPTNSPCSRVTSTSRTDQILVPRFGS